MFGTTKKKPSNDSNTASNQPSQQVVGLIPTNASPFSNDSLLLSQSFPYNATTNGNLLATPGERIPSITSFTSNPKSYSNYGSHITNSTGQKMTDTETTPVFSDSTTLNSLSYHTLGQMADQFRTDSKQTVSTEFVGDEYDEEDNDQTQITQGAESTGRWTRLEHQLFLEALKKYGKEWKKVAGMVKTRTVVQTRTHAQKYFQKVSKSTSGGTTASGGGGQGGYSEDDFAGPNDYSHNESSARRLSNNSMSKRHRRVDGKVMSPQPFVHHEDFSSTPAHLLSYSSTPGSAYFTSDTSFDNHHVGAEYLIDENSLGRDSMVLSELHMTPLSIPPPPPSSGPHSALGFPQPSPAACGKRKHAELQAAQMLAASSTVDLEGAEVLSMLKDESGRKRPPGLSLAIIHPEQFPAPPDDVPTTPWVNELKALEARSSTKKVSGGSLPVATPSDQKNFLSKVRALVQSADIAGLKTILNNAEYSAQSFLDNNGSGFGATVPSVSNLMTTYSTPGNGATTKPPGANDQSSYTFRKTPGTTLVARSLNRTDKRELSVLMEAISLDPATFSQQTIYDLCTLLVDHGASASLTDSISSGNTALHLAAASGYEAIGRLLLAKGCPVNAQNSDGDSATHIAAKHGHGHFLEMLADLGANCHLRNKQAACALDLAGTVSGDVAQRTAIRRLMLAKEPRLRTLVLYHDDCLEHTARRATDWEGPDRLVSIMKRLRDRKEFPEFELEISNQFEKGSVELLSRAHSQEYLSFVNDLSTQLNSESDAKTGFKEPALPFTPQVQKLLRNQSASHVKSAEAADTSFSSGTLTAARRAAGAVAHAVDCVLSGRNRNVFCAVRPPGHHVGHDGLLEGGYSCGFCIFNSIAAGALHALDSHHTERVAIIDLDVHHGNGTEDIVRRYSDPSRLFFFSLHLFDKEPPGKDTPTGFHFYPGSGAADDNIHNIINVPIPPLWKDENGALSPGGEDTTSNATKSASSTSSSGSASPAVPTVPSSSGVSPLKMERGESALSIGTDWKSVTKTLNAATLFGREAYRQAILQRLIPSLRAFNPSLILLSSGFDAAAGDVGNCRNYPGLPWCKGMDLAPEDFAWATSEIMKIADLCCNGKLVSVLEGGYGQYERHNGKLGRSHAPATRLGTRHGVSQSAEFTAQESAMNREVLSSAVAAHVHRLVDPFGPSRTTNERNSV